MEQGSGDAKFRLLPPEETGINFANTLTETEDWNIIEYLYFYNGGGLAVGDVNNDSLPDLFFTANMGPNALYLNRGGLQFEDATEAAGVGGAGNWSTGAVMVDINADGWQDIYVCQVGAYKDRKGRNELFINNQDGTFTEQAAVYGLDFEGFSTHAAFFDYDRDGDLDCYLLNHSVHSPENYVKATVRQQPDQRGGDRLYRNEGGQFVEVTQEAGIYSSRIGFGLGVAVSDVNKDGWPDLYISNDFHENDYLYLNQGDGTFKEQAARLLGHTSTFSMGSDIADFNNDGWTDILSLDMKPADEAVLKASVGADPYNIYQFKLRYGYHYQYPRNMLQLNQGIVGDSLRFSEIGQLAGVAATDWSWAPLFADMDNDGRKDLFVANGILRRPNDLDYLKFISNDQVQASATDLEMAQRMPGGAVPNYAFRNTGGLAFEPKSQEWGFRQKGCTNAAAFADLDLDGDLDLVTNNLNAPASIFSNQTNGKKALQLRLEQPGLNPEAIGSRVEVVANGQLQVQEVFRSRGFQSGTVAGLHFGLDTLHRADTVRVRWPDGTWQVWAGLAAGRQLLRKSATDEPLGQPAPHRRWFEELAPTDAGLDYVHQENEYNDFDREKLLPHQLSTQGPALAVTERNGSPLIYLGGSFGQNGQLYEVGDGQFRPVSPEATLEGSRYEDADAAFFDANGDGREDLVVVSGGGEVGAGERVAPRLYLQDQGGRFQPFSEAFPDAVATNAGCVVAFDFERDGDQDLFIGGRSLPGSYGLPGRSYVLLNDGRGRFRVAEEAGFVRDLGMVTGAVYLPGLHQLIIAGAWMPVTRVDLATGQAAPAWENAEGWWVALSVADLNADGRLDLLLGNLGLNSNLSASPEAPLELFVKDLDENGTPDPVMAYYRQGQRYSVASKDELAAQWVGIKKRYLDYTPFANATFEQLFDGERLADAYYRKITNLASGYAIQGAGGSFTFHPFPRRAQISPLFALLAADADADGELEIIAGGNWHGVRPALGRYDASLGVVLDEQEGGWKALPPRTTGLSLLGECRGLQVIRPTAASLWLLAARNDDSPQLFRFPAVPQ